MKLTEVISKEEYYDLYLTEDFKSKLKSLGLAGLFALGLTLGADANAKPHTAQELENLGFGPASAKFISKQDEKTQQMLIKAKQKETDSSSVEPKKQSKTKPKAEPKKIDTKQIGNNIELYAKYWMRGLGYDTKMFGHQQGKYMLSDKVEGAPKGNGYWNFQIKVENRYGGSDFVPVIIGFANYKMNSIKIDGKSYDVPGEYDIRKSPNYK